MSYEGNNDRLWRDGPKFARGPGGAFVQVEELVDATDLRPAQEYSCHHKKLRGERRCAGCGRTQAEIRLDEGA